MALQVTNSGLQAPDFLKEIQQESERLGFSAFAAVSLEKPLSLEFYKNWLSQNYHGDMLYLERHLEQKENPKSLSPKMRSALVFAHPYFPHPEKQEHFKAARVALYAQGKDYHLWLKEKLQLLVEKLKTQCPQEEFLAMTDSAPVMERDLAYRAGLGWFGKNSCLIHPKKGSLFFISEIYSSMDLEPPVQSLPDFCGTCNRCIEVCPTQALVDKKTLDARKCISYLTIESREIPEEPLREKIGDWLFGCDLCQTVCPWNQKLFKGLLESAPQKQLDLSEKENLLEDLRWILTTSGKQIQKKLKSSPLLRAGPFGLRRNAIIVATNQQLSELKPEIEYWKKDQKLESLVEWSLTRLSNGRTRTRSPG